MIGTLDQARSRIVARHIATEYARDNVTKALYEAVLDGLEFGPRICPMPRIESGSGATWRFRFMRRPTPHSRSSSGR